MLKGTKVGYYRKSGRKLSKEPKRGLATARSASRIGSHRKSTKNQYAIYIEQQENLEIDNALFTLQSLEKSSVGNRSY